MNDFKVGDEIYYVTSGRDYSIQHISDIQVIKDFIDKVYDIGSRWGDNNIYLYSTINRPKDEPPISSCKLYISKQDCIDAFKKRLNDIERAGEDMLSEEDRHEIEINVLFKSLKTWQEMLKQNKYNYIDHIPRARDSIEIAIDSLQKAIFFLGSRGTNHGD